MTALRAMTGLLALWSTPLAAQQGASPLAGVRLEVDSISSAPEYFIYNYHAANPTNSKGGIAVVSIDLSAPTGTGFLTLPATGPFWHIAGFPGVDRSKFREHVPVGPISPGHWKATLVKEGTMDWYGTAGGAEGQGGDSIGPGGSLGGFGLRSPFLPGLRVSAADPTAASCCTQVRSSDQAHEAEYPNAIEFRIRGWTVGPVYPPQSMTFGTVGNLLGRVCGDLHWITHGGVCGRLQALSASAAAADHRGDGETRSDSLRAFLTELEAQHGPGKAVNDNAYWLLKVNGEYLL